MNCPNCRLHLSDYLEKAVTPALRREVHAHLEECRSCAADLRDLEVSLTRLRDVAAVAAPPGLAASVTARLLSAAPAAARPELDPESMSRNAERPSRENERAFFWATLAAASLMIAAASFLAGHLVSRGPSAETLATLEGARGQVRSLERQLGDTRAKLVEENSALRREVMSVKGALEEWKIEHASALESEQKTRRALDRRLQEATRRIEAQDAALAALEERLSATVEERDEAIARKEELGQELASARTELARARSAASESRRQRSITAAPSGADRREYREAPPVLLVREGDNILRLKTRGALEDVGPHLFNLAENDNEPDIADLALTTLEARLAPYAPDDEVEDADRSPPGRAGLAGWFNRQVGFASVAAEAPVEATTDRGARLDRLRRIWQEREVR